MPSTNDPDWLGPATDCLKDRGLDEAADRLAAEPALRGRMERAIAWMEREIRDSPDHYRLGLARDAVADEVKLVAEHRGETPEETLARLRPIPRTDGPPWPNLPRIAMDTRSLPPPGQFPGMSLGEQWVATNSGPRLEPGLTYFRCCGVTRLAGLICPLCRDERGEMLHG